MNQKKNTECWYLWIIGCGAIDTKVRTDTQSIEFLLFYILYTGDSEKKIIYNMKYILIFRNS